jgi:hypothetical protein
MQLPQVQPYARVLRIRRRQMSFRYQCTGWLWEAAASDADCSGITHTFVTASLLTITDPCAGPRRRVRGQPPGRLRQNHDGRGCCHRPLLEPVPPAPQQVRRRPVSLSGPLPSSQCACASSERRCLAHRFSLRWVEQRSAHHPQASPLSAGRLLTARSPSGSHWLRLLTASL